MSNEQSTLDLKIENIKIYSMSRSYIMTEIQLKTKVYDLPRFDPLSNIISYYREVNLAISLFDGAAEYFKDPENFDFTTPRTKLLDGATKYFKNPKNFEFTIPIRFFLDDGQDDAETVKALLVQLDNLLVDILIGDGKIPVSYIVKDANTVIHMAEIMKFLDYNHLPMARTRLRFIIDEYIKNIEEAKTFSTLISYLGNNERNVGTSRYHIFVATLPHNYQTVYKYCKRKGDAATMVYSSAIAEIFTNWIRNMYESPEKKFVFPSIAIFAELIRSQKNYFADFEIDSVQNAIIGGDGSIQEGANIQNANRIATLAVQQKQRKGNGNKKNGKSYWRQSRNKKKRG